MKVAEQLFILLQHALPARPMARLIHALSRSHNRAVKNLMIRSFVRLYGVDVSEAAREVPAGYESFNAFFTRELRPGCRPSAADPDCILSPADGTIQQIGVLAGSDILQVKGMTYSAVELLGGDLAESERYRDGSFATIYLAPWNYHRVHMPITGRVRRMTHVPGCLWSVNAVTAARVPGLFARNERIICHCESRDGPFALVLVGALNVGSISTAWAGEVLPRRARSPEHWDYPGDDPRTRLERGDFLGQFNMGSTVIVLLPCGAGRWRTDLTAGSRVLMGSALGHVPGRTA